MKLKPGDIVNVKVRISGKADLYNPVTITKVYPLRWIVEGIDNDQTERSFLYSAFLFEIIGFDPNWQQLLEPKPKKEPKPALSEHDMLQVREFQRLYERRTEEDIKGRQVMSNELAFASAIVDTCDEVFMASAANKAEAIKTYLSQYIGQGKKSCSKLSA